MFLSSSFQRKEMFGIVQFEKIESFRFFDSSKISDFYVKTKCKELLNTKITIIIMDEHSRVIVNVGAVLSEYENNPILKDVNGIFSKTKFVTITISALVDSAENFFVNEFQLEWNSTA